MAVKRIAQHFQLTANRIAWTALMNLADNDLMDLFLRRTEPQGDLDTPEVTAVLEMVRKR